jgi:general secretion pathway protein B
MEREAGSVSYILEALKKLEQKRERDRAPERLILSLGHEERRRKRLFWPYVLAAVLFLNALVMVWWMSGHEGEKGGSFKGQAGALQAPGSMRPAPAAGDAEKAAIPAGTSGPGTAKAAAGETSGPARPVMPGDEDYAGKGGSIRAAAPPKEPPAAEPPAKAAEKVAPPAAPEAGRGRNAKAARRVLEIKELPQSIRGALPEFRISGHAYSPEPQTRVARINEKIIQEGQELAPGLRVEEIIPDGVIFAFQGYRFRVGLNGGK